MGDQQSLDARMVRRWPAIRKRVQQRLGPELEVEETISDIAPEPFMERLQRGPAFRVSAAGHFRLLIAWIAENMLVRRRRQKVLDIGEART